MRGWRLISILPNTKQIIDKCSASHKEKIVLLEFVDEAKSFLNYCQNQSLSLRDFHIIVLEPKVQIFLKNLNIPYENTFHYFSNQEHKRALLKSEEWYRFIVDKLDIEDGTEIKEMYNNTFLFYLRFYMNHLLMFVELLSSICHKHNVESIYTCLYQKKVCVNNIPHIQYDERYLGIITKKFAEHRGIIWQEIKAPHITKNIDNSKSFSVNIKKNTEKLIFLFYNFLILKLNHKKTILLPTTGYNIGNLVRKLKTKFPNTKWISLETFMSTSIIDTKNQQILKRNLDKAIKELQKHIEYFNYNGTNFVEIFSEKIKKDLNPYLIKLHSESIVMRKIINSLNIKLCISPYGREIALLLGELCKNKEIPTIMICHGTFRKPKNKLEEIEYFHLGESAILSKYYDYVSIQTPNEEKGCWHYKRKNNLIRTGPLIFSKPYLKNKEKYKNNIIGNIDNNIKILVYPENFRISRGALRFHVFEMFDEFLSSASDLVNAINAIEGVHLIIRIHPGRKITSTEVKSLLPPSNKLTVSSSKRPFFELLTITDLMISFSSTVIEDALQSYIPVLLYDKRGRYMHSVSQELGPNIIPKYSAVYYIKDSSFLKNGLQWISNNHLKKNIPKSIFNRYVFQENYYDNFVDLISNKIGNDVDK